VTIGADPFSLTVKRDVSAGYATTTFLYSCSTPQMTASTTKDITLSVQQYKDCSADIKTKTSFTVTESKLTYSATTASIDLVPSYSDIFEQETQPDCGAITQCNLYKADCINQLGWPQLTYVTMDTTNPWKVTQ
jgi:hypothetical protein